VERDGVCLGRPSLIASRDINCGEFLSEDMVKISRPGTGLSPVNLEKVMGKRVCFDVKENTPLSWEHFGLLDIL